MGDGVEAGHDPLGAMVELCHRRGIEVHAWFVNGAYGAPAPGRILDAHPDWAVDSLTGEIWYDLGKPAIAINALGKGKVLLLNWHAEESIPGPAAETAARLLSAWGVPKEKALALNTRANRARYGDSLAAAGARLFARLGYPGEIVDESRLADLAPGRLLILPALYIIPEDAAKRIEGFVEAGGIAVAIDGPSPSMKIPAVRRIFGFARSGDYFQSDLCVFRSTGRSEYAPSAGRTIDIAKERIRAEKWAEFRAWGVTQLVREVRRAAKAAKPAAQASAAVLTPLASARRVCQDWPAWIRAHRRSSSRSTISAGRAAPAGMSSSRSST